MKQKWFSKIQDTFCEQPGSLALGIIASALFVFIYSPFIYYSLHAFPSSDDWWYGETAKNDGAWSYSLELYKTYHARLLSNYLIGKIMGSPYYLELYRLYFLVFYISLPIGFIYTAKQLKALFSIKNPVPLYILALMLPVFWLYNFHLPSELYFWLAGGATYTLACLLSLVSLGFLLKYLNTLKKRFSVLSGISGSLAMLCNESTAIFMLGFFLLFTIYQLFKGKMLSKDIIHLNTLPIITFIFIATAPGHIIRQQEYEGFNLSNFSVKSVIYDFGFHFGSNYIFKINSLIFFVFTLVLMTLLSSKRQTEKTDHKIFILAGLIFMSLIPAQFMLINFKYKTLVYSRSVNTMYFYFLIALMFLYFPIFQKLHIDFAKRRLHKKHITTTSILIFFILLFLHSPQALTMYKDVDCLTQYAKEEEQRLIKIEEVKRQGQHDIAFKKLSCIPKMSAYYNIDETKHVLDHNREYYKRFFGLKNIKTE